MVKELRADKVQALKLEESILPRAQALRRKRRGTLLRTPSSYRGTAEPQAGPSSSALELVDPPAGRESDTDVDEEQGSNFGTSSEAHDWGDCGDSDDPPGRRTSSWETVKDDCEEFERDSKASGSQFADDNVNDTQPGDAFVVDKVLQLPPLQSLRP
ncbi:hypothetical protein BD310DRAFT_978865 [Dichomitus squalens]|uniref:Uncharacterized protein n=1 Tax=Dichomitus squalens TaxID=114155 RepID=A0A4Q9PQ45_9APHY|nr:hypothetical protein BD310DRAFT_978865 [Dichomitus squalens]